MPAQRIAARAMLAALLILCFSVSAEYYYVGYDDYAQGRSYITDFDTYARTFTSVDGLPVVGDVDDDGDQEIVIADNGNIRLYSLPQMGIIDSYTDSYIETGRRDIQLINIDDDDYLEIVTIADADNNVTILEYDGASFSSTRLTAAGTLGGSHDNILKCDSANKKCLLMGTTGATTGSLVAYGFNATHISAAVTIDSTAGHVWCGNLEQGAYVGDVDNDGVNEYVTSWTYGSDPGAEQVYIVEVVLTGITPSKDRESSKINSVETINSGSCNSYAGRDVTSPLCYDFDGSPGNGLECVIGYRYDADEFMMAHYNSLLTSGSTYPGVGQADGAFMSNPFRAVVFPDSDADFCVAGYNGGDGTFLDILCHSLQTGDSVSTLEFKDSVDIDYALTYSSIGRYPGIMHSVQATPVLTDGTDLTEAIGPYGVIVLPYATCTLGQCDAVSMFDAPKANSTIIAVDNSGLGRADYIAATATNVYVYDDGYSDQAPTITSYDINPCLGSTWQINTTASVSFVAVDPEGQDVTASVTYYYGSSQALPQTPITTASGSTFVFTDTMNTTIGSSYILLNATDSTGHSTTQTLAFSVGTTGVVYGDCVTHYDSTAATTTDDETTSQQTPTSGNAVAQFAQDVNSYTGIGLSALWLIVMVAVSIAIFIYGNHQGETHLIPLILLLNAFLLVVGVLLGFFSTPVIVTIVILAVVIGGIYIRNIFSGGGD